MPSPTDISDAERAVIEIFADHIRREHSNIMPVREVLARAGSIQPTEMRSAMEKLADRGWLISNAALHWEPDRECLLMGEGLRIAQMMPRESSRAPGDPRSSASSAAPDSQPGERHGRAESDRT